MTLLLELRRDLPASRTRGVLTGLGMFLSIASTISVLCASAVVTDVFVAREEQADGRAVTMRASLDVGALPNGGEVGQLVNALTERISRRGGAFALTVELVGSVGYPTGAKLAGVQIMAVAGELEKVRRLPLISGEWFNGDFAFPPSLMLNQAAARSLDANVETLLSVKPFRKTTRSFSVSGIMSDGQNSPLVLVPISSLTAAVPSGLPAAGPASILVHRAGASPALLREELEEVWQDLGIDGSTLAVDRADKVDELTSRLRNAQAGFLLAAGITLGIAVLGVANIGLASVRERSRELLIRRSVGATRWRIFALVLGASLWICLLAFLAAMTLGLLAVYLLVPLWIGHASPIEAPAFPWAAAGLAGLVTILGAASGAAYPALVASRVTISRALRE